MSADVDVVVGSATYKFKDTLDWVLNSRDSLKNAILGSVWCVPIIAVIELGFNKSSLLSTLVLIAVLMLVIFVFSIIFTPVILWVSHLKLRQEDLQITWTFTKQEVSVEDTTGKKTTIPWKQIKDVQFKSKGLILYVEPKGSRWVPNRLFAEDDLSTLKSWVDAGSY